MATQGAQIEAIGPVGEPRIETVEGAKGKFLGVMSWCPELTKDFFAFEGRVWSDWELDVRVKDLCRMKIARTVGCRICQQTRFKVAEGATTESDYVDIDDFESSTNYTDAEKAALRYVEAFSLDPRNVTDEIVEELNRYFSAKEIVELSILNAVMSGFGSINVALNIAPDDDSIQTFDFANPVA